MTDYPDHSVEFRAKTGPTSDAVDRLVSELWRVLADYISRSTIVDGHVLALRLALATYRKCSGCE